ncbi:MAG: transcriptional regulator [Candidatus Rokuibacteriota bacterium]|nr:MAG: transcriptional regulator [Candidatus Rokubacteria bacterium]
MTSGRSLQASAEAATTRNLSGPPRGALSLAAVLAALSDPVRLEIVCRLANGHERSCGSLGLPIAKSTLTHHLKVLREAGVIVQRPVGTSRMTCLRRKDLDARFPGLLDSVLTAARKRHSRAYASRRPLL